MIGRRRIKHYALYRGRTTKLLLLYDGGEKKNSQRKNAKSYVT